MGYCVNVDLDSVVIPKSEIKKALLAINSIPAKDYSWVNHTADFSNLIDALDEWRFLAQEDKEGNVKIEEFNGEKAGDDEILFNALAPYITKGAEIIYRGEDGATWKYKFDGKKMLVGLFLNN